MYYFNDTILEILSVYMIQLENRWTDVKCSFYIVDWYSKAKLLTLPNNTTRSLSLSLSLSSFSSLASSEISSVL
jgi:hypothetical protein